MKRMTAFLLSAAILIFALSGCEIGEKRLEGTYSARTYTNRTDYEFDKDGNVEVNVFAAGFLIYSNKGTYSISSDENLITLTFETENQADIPGFTGGTFTLGGTFDFIEKEDYILIGTVRYDKSSLVSNDYAYTASESSPQTDSPSDVSQGNTPDNPTESKTESLTEIPVNSAEINNFRLNMPEEFSIEYKVTEKYGIITRTYSQKMIKTDAGIFLDLGDTGDKYVFEPQGNGKYIEYQYNRFTEKYETPMISDAVRVQLDNGAITLDSVCVGAETVAGFTSRITCYFDFYEAYRGVLEYRGTEDFNGITCQKYTANYSVPYSANQTELLIEPEYGICVKGNYYCESEFSAAAQKEIERVGFSTSDLELPDYKSMS